VYINDEINMNNVRKNVDSVSHENRVLVSVKKVTSIRQYNQQEK